MLSALDNGAELYDTMSGGDAVIESKSAADILLEAIDNSGVELPADVMVLIRAVLPMMPDEALRSFTDSARDAAIAKANGDMETYSAIVAKRKQEAYEAGYGPLFDQIMSGVI